MRAAIYTQFQQPLSIEIAPDPAPSDDGVVIAVKACGICRSDWHGWMGNDPDIKLPHVPGHELAGVIESVGSGVRRFKPGDRITVPFVGGCGICPECVSGNHQVCDRQFQPGFTAWGAFAEYVAVDYADTNLVRLPDEIDFVTASSLGCRFITSFRAVKHQGQVAPDQWVAVWGCGGVGLSAIMIAKGLGANVVAVDIDDATLEFAKSIGTDHVINSTTVTDVVDSIKETSGGGAHVSIEALGHPQLVADSIASLRKRGKHIQVGILEPESQRVPVPINVIMGRELEILGSHGMQAYKYVEVFEMIRDGRLEPSKLVGKTVSLDQGAIELTNMNSFSGLGVKVIAEF
ncbi:MAG TPA: zinc-dependent alcohol dehydrogenase family protein [Pyrinomonadaceae bacterium]|nr:zinc-dependent alcohol dehydrogenase family protein [Pyrinomonadaceae bacterium]